METRVRKNTVKIVCSSGSKTPAHLEVLKFALQHLKVPPADLHSVYRDENENRFYLKFVDEARFSSFMSGLEETYMFPYEDGTVTRVHLELASRIFRYVRIFSLPPEIEDKDIAQVLGQYGTIRQQVRERFAAAHGVNIYTGVRGVHMEVAKEIPPHVYIGHFRARIFYDGLKNKCFLCKGEGHVKADCPRMVAKNGGSGETSYANVAALGAVAKYQPPTDNVQLSESSTNATEDQQTTSAVITATPNTAITETPQQTTSNAELDEAKAGHEVTRSEVGESSPLQPEPADPNNSEEMDMDERKAALKRAMISSSEDDTSSGKETPFVTVQQRKGRIDAKKGKIGDQLPTTMLEKRSVSKSNMATLPKVVPNQTKRSK